MTHEMAVEIGDLVDQANQDPAVTAVLLRGRGSVFCAGFDLSGSPGRSTEPAAVQARIAETIWTFHRDLVLAQAGRSPGSGRLRRRRLRPDAGVRSDAFARTTRAWASRRSSCGAAARCGSACRGSSAPKTGKYIALTGIKVTADQALSMQIVNEVVPAAELEAPGQRLS